MRATILASVIVSSLVVGGVALYVLLAPIGIPTQSSTQNQSTTNQASPASTDFACAKPAVVYQYTCDQLPQGYVIPPRLPNAPAPYCPTQMTPSACLLFRQTFGTGVCTPNETAFTDPLDCGCLGALLADPYTGRCGSPATVCQQQAVIRQAQGG